MANSKAIPALVPEDERGSTDGSRLAKGKQRERSRGGYLSAVRGSPVGRWLAARTISEALALSLFVFYAVLFYQSVSRLWFHPMWTTDDALQQIYPFHKVFHPENFRGDLVTDMMERYLAPLHYWVGYGVTWLVGDPIMMGHWVMLIQLILGLGFFFFAVRALAGTTAGFFAITWLLHTRLVMQRLTAGLPRGWALPVITAGLYFIVTSRHRAMLVTLALGCLLHPPATLVAAMCYGITLVWRTIRRDTRVETLPHLRRLIILSPLYAVVTLAVTQMPEHIGTMADLARAAQMPEFQRGGRFPFYPLLSIEQEMRTFAFQSFVARLHSPGPFFRRWAPEIVLGLLAFIVGAGAWRRRGVVPAELWFFLFSSLAVYLASREFAFKLYVPNRHIQIPLAIFFITAFTVGVWRLFFRAPSGAAPSGDGRGEKELRWRATTLRCAGVSVLALAVLGGFIYRLGGSGLQGTLNFNYNRHQRGVMFDWVREHTPPDALIAGHPTFIDPVQLFGMRRGYVTTETSHPFYDVYYKEMARRLDIVLRAYYAPSLEEVVRLLEPEGVTHVVFARGHFSPEGLAQAKYFPPFADLVKELTSGGTFAFAEIPEELDPGTAPYLVYVDDRSKIIDLKLLARVLRERQGDAHSRRPISLPGHRNL